ncbi:hypothetical protein D7B24_000464 [Verticillium nonalfalfae]|uniref:Uncharacterized protein n=2 Tax=Verticillium TaxID=1036719 RepID=A0A444RIP9_VERDA|nr:uncharacterized protein D7B24_000464 [Verticillium nonalfalfae]PNH43014.1 hypothetical protein VD0004_g4386 [Verticillium dahliae]PNH73353.1 hypothetical protein VD0001_g4203 [Verticillium dahliae]RNJ54448.1 hypothetical protein D7B24_000464 [Verticillium nonalfalfae]RXG41073.1 hypothetical protein VDGE_30285 [Verticillium dahliae]
MKKQNAELCQRVYLLEEFFHLLTLRSDYECKEIIHRMREVNLGNALDHQFEFVKSGHLHTDPIADPIDDGPEEPTQEAADSIVLPGASIDEATVLLKDL